MRCYLIREFRVTVLSGALSGTPGDAELIESVNDLDQNRFPLIRLVAIWNALPDTEPLTRFRDRPSALRRVWAALEAQPVSSRRIGSKQARMIYLLQRPGGASLDDLVSVTGWQRHSVRGVLSGVIRKKPGLRLTTLREGGQRMYRVVSK